MSSRQACRRVGQTCRSDRQGGALQCGVGAAEGEPDYQPSRFSPILKKLIRTWLSRATLYYILLLIFL